MTEDKKKSSIICSNGFKDLYNPRTRVLEAAERFMNIMQSSEWRDLLEEGNQNLTPKQRKAIERKRKRNRYIKD